MNETVSLIAIIVLVAIIASFLTYKAIEIIRLSPEDKKKKLVSYLVALVNQAEGFIGAGHGKEKLEQVEKWFDEKAPISYKIILKLLGKENLKGLIEDALKEIKENFGK